MYNLDKSIRLDDSLYFSNKLSHIYSLYDYEKIWIKKRKIFSKIRPGISKNLNKNSIKRDKNNILIQQFINIIFKNGEKAKLLKNTNLMVENLFLVLNEELKEFTNYNLYSNLVYLHNSNNLYSDINYLLHSFALDFKSIFEIKTIKNNKKIKSENKYSHEIVYIPSERRLKYVLKSLNIYKENFKNYNLWERIFWSFFLTLINKKNSFLNKRREFIYVKSVKFFKKKK